MDYISHFCDYLAHQKRYSLHTVTAYKNDLEQFFSFLQLTYQIESPKKVEHQLIRSWIVQLIENKISPRSVHRKISSLKSFFKYLLKNELIDQNPLTRIILPKADKRLPIYVKENEIAQLLNNIPFDNNFEGIRNKLIIELFYTTGIRLSELINIQLAAIDFNHSSLKIVGKRNKERIIPLTNKLAKSITDYIVYRKEIASQSEFLLLTSKGKKLYEKLVYRIVNHYLSLTTTINKKSPHILRHTFATHMLNNGADLNTIKEILGHANLAATQVYTHNTVEQLKNIHQQAHPRA